MFGRIMGGGGDDIHVVPNVGSADNKATSLQIGENKLPSGNGDKLMESPGFKKLQEKFKTLINIIKGTKSGGATFFTPFNYDNAQTGVANKELAPKPITKEPERVVQDDPDRTKLQDRLDELSEKPQTQEVENERMALIEAYQKIPFPKKDYSSAAATKELAVHMTKAKERLAETKSKIAEIAKEPNRLTKLKSLDRMYRDANAVHKQEMKNSQDMTTYNKQNNNKYTEYKNEQVKVENEFGEIGKVINEEKNSIRNAIVNDGMKNKTMQADLNKIREDVDQLTQEYNKADKKDQPVIYEKLMAAQSHYNTISITYTTKVNGERYDDLITENSTITEGNIQKENENLQNKIDELKKSPGYQNPQRGTPESNILKFYEDGLVNGNKRLFEMKYKNISHLEGKLGAEKTDEGRQELSKQIAELKIATSLDKLAFWESRRGALKGDDKEKLESLKEEFTKWKKKPPHPSQINVLPAEVAAFEKDCRFHIFKLTQEEEDIS